MRSRPLLVALVLAAYPHAAWAATKPPLVLADSRLELGQPVDVYGRECDGGHWHFLSVTNGDTPWNVNAREDGKPDGTWHEQIPLNDQMFVPGRYLLGGNCSDGTYPGVPYPTTSFQILPPRDAKIVGDLAVSAHTVHAGDRVHVSGSAYQNEDAAVFLAGSRRFLAQFPVSEAHAWSGSLTVPTDLDPGTYRLEAMVMGPVARKDPQDTYAATITVVSDAPAPTPTPTSAPVPTSAAPRQTPAPTTAAPSPTLSEATEPTPSESATYSMGTLTTTDDRSVLAPIAIAGGAGTAAAAGAAFVIVRRRRRHTP